MTDTEQALDPDRRFEAVIIDWAGTITAPMHELIRDAAKAIGFPEDKLAEAFAGLAEYFLTDDSPIHEAERGRLDDDDLAAYLEERAPGAGQLILGTEGASLLTGADRPEMIELLEDLRDADVAVVMATNNFRLAQELLAVRYLDSGLVSAIVNSALIGYRKPEPEFYELALEAAGVDAEDALFIDDQQRNLDPAVALGMGTVLVSEPTGEAIAAIRSAVLD